jgi:carboxylesterase
MDNRIGCLIIHGFSGNLQEIEPLNQYLLSRNIITECPQLKGHTGRRRDLARVHYTDWIESAEKCLLKLFSYCEETVLIGFSMGGLIAVNLALKHKISKVVTLSTPIYCWDKRNFLINVTEDFRSRQLVHINHYARALIRTPLTAMINFEILKHKTKPLIKKVNQPIFVAQGLQDDTVQPRSADYIFSNAASMHKQIKYYHNSGHIICRSADGQSVFRDVLGFIQDRAQLN